MTSPAETSTAWFGFLDERLRAAVAAAVAVDASPDDALRGLYISDEQALALAADERAADPDERLALAAARLDLDALDSAVLGVCAGPELHPRYERLYGYLQDDVTRRLASPRLAADLLAGDGVERRDVLACFGADAPLLRTGAIELLSGDGNLVLAARPVRVAERLAAFLLGAEGGLAETGAPVALRRAPISVGEVGRDAACAEVRRLLAIGSRLPLLVCGPDAAAIVAAAAERPLMIVAARDLATPEPLRDATLAAALEGALLCIDGLENLEPAQRPALVRTVHQRTQRTILLGVSRAATVACSDVTALVVDVAMPSFGERRALWETLTGASDARSVAAKFRLSMEQIREASEVARIAAESRDRATPQAADLDLGARHASSSRLGELASRLDPAYSWDDIVLPEHQLELLLSVSSYLRHRDRVLSDWGYERTVARTQGLKVLFAGESGTGKTMAAQVLGAELGLEMFRVDLATVVSKYIGETEKNLERIFTAADGSNAILFFDEADALFGKRSEVSDAHDRYANIEVAYLLQRMEIYPGAVILATNYRQNIDDAFVRRLDFVVDFPFPEAEHRRHIWRLLLPPQAPIADDVDLDHLAAQFKLSGGAIRNCSLSAAFQAADEDSPIAMRHLVRAVAQEYGKQGRLTLAVDFERFEGPDVPGEVRP